MVNRGCAECARLLPKESFTKNQWRKGVGASRCNACVHGGGEHKREEVVKKTARENLSNRAEYDQYDLDHPFGEGSFRWVALGKYTRGPRRGERSVCKWFKKGSVFEETFFALDIKAAERAIELVRSWNAEGYVKQMVRLNRPEVWTFDRHSTRAGQKVLSEPFVEDYQKFNSNSGWADSATPWPRVMQALSHYSYHKSGGQFVLCDLQGGVYKDGVVLTDPVILSRTRTYGVTDLGPEGISTFFHRHECNEFCRSKWARPKHTRDYFPIKKGTSMEHPSSVPARSSRAPMSKQKPQMAAIQEYDDDDDDDDDDYYGDYY